MKRPLVGFLALLLVFVASPAASQSVASMRQAAESGEVSGQYRLGLAYRDGTGVPKDAQQAYFWLSLAAAFSIGDAHAAAQSALSDVTKGMTDTDIRAADKLGFAEIQRLADVGRAWAQAFLGAAYHAGTSDLTPKNPALGVQWLEKAAAQGEVRAQFLLGMTYLRGDGIPADARRAMAFFRAAADQGHAQAQARLGTAYFDGAGVLQDYKEAFRWWQLAADQGIAEAQANLGDLYRVGDNGVAQDYAQAVRWYRRAADQGHAVAQSNLGALYERGLGVPQDPAQAVKWYALSAAQGYSIGQFNLGLMLEQGTGARQDRIEAHKWLNLAAARASGDYQKSFAESRDRVAKSMTPAEIAEAQKRAREWLDEFDRGGVPTPPAASATPVRAGGAIAVPARLKHVEPVYPPVAITARIQGLVIVEATIGPDGSVSDAKILRSPSPLLESAALDAVRQWQYAPTLLNGVPVPVIMTVTVNFTLK